MATAYLKKVLNFLGPDYCLRTIDWEECIYRRINASYDLEISGAYKKNHPISIFIWDVSNGLNSSAHVVEYRHQIKSPEELKSVLNEIIPKYLSNSQTSK